MIWHYGHVIPFSRFHREGLLLKRRSPSWNPNRTAKNTPSSDPYTDSTAVCPLIFGMSSNTIKSFLNDMNYNSKNGADFQAAAGDILEEMVETDRVVMI